MTDCEQIHFTEAAENAELRYILSEMAKLKTSRAKKFKGGIVAAIKIKDFCRFYPVISRLIPLYPACLKCIKLSFVLQKK